MTAIEHAYWLGANTTFAALQILNGDWQFAAKQLQDAIGHAEALSLDEATVNALRVQLIAVRSVQPPSVHTINGIVKALPVIGRALENQS